MTDSEWTDYSTRLVLSAHANGVREGYRLAARLAMENRALPLSDIVKKLLDRSVDKLSDCR